MIDFISIGSPGFAQLGQIDYYDKLAVEKAIVKVYLETNYLIPLSLSGICWFKWKSFDHDFGTYHELCLIYNRTVVDNWELDDDNGGYEKHDAFWEFANECESMDLEELEQECINLVKIEELCVME